MFELVNDFRLFNALPRIFIRTHERVKLSDDLLVLDADGAYFVGIVRG